MKFLTKLFSERTDKSNQPHKWSMNPYQARYRAKMTVDSARKLGVTLDYSPESLKDVDMLIDKERETGIGLTKEMAAVMLSLGAYVGEVMVRNMGAKWAYGGRDEKHDPLMIIVKDRYAINVVSMVFRRFILGNSHSIAGMYEETEKLTEKQ